MGDKITGCDIKTLLSWILAEEKTESIFGIRHELFFQPDASDPFRMNRYGRLLETPLGVAAGPHSQLSQNIITAWLTGARYMELKTVQVLDELEVTKPCIDMRDEGYNCEWSQELKLNDSFSEYLNAWVMLHLLRHRLTGGADAGGDPGFIFNMSVGYNLEGIRSSTVQQFLDQMQDCSQEKNKVLHRLAEIYPAAADIEIPDTISDNITISTMHGCPPDEIERIGRYFIEERRLNTTIKLNPTLLGPEQLREILNRRLGYEITVPDEAFEHDLTYDAGISLISNLQAAAAKSGVAFGIKLTNTLEAQNSSWLPVTEKMVYMSGRALHAISINLAAKLQQAFNGELDISFSAGVDFRNILRVLSCGLAPVTVCSDILKPGGYGRMHQYLQEIRNGLEAEGCGSLAEYARATAGRESNSRKAALSNLAEYAATVVDDPYYHKQFFPFDSIKTDRPLTPFDCTAAPCISNCPAGQAIPAYMRHTAAGDDEAAFRVILETNPFPNVQGMVCHAPCRHKCTRMNLDQPLAIREIKRFVADRNRDFRPPSAEAPETGRIAIIGGGPSGLSCAWFMALAGFSVDLFEAKPFVGGMAADAIPEFRLAPESLARDIETIKSLGVRMHTQQNIDLDRFREMQQAYDAVYIAVGAQRPLKLDIPGEDAETVLDQLTFLSRVRRGDIPTLGGRIAVIGAGNAAMDAARTAKRIAGDSGEVTILYRRTRREMPAEEEEIRAAEAEGVRVVELVSPERILVEDGLVTAVECVRMTLGEPDDSGRRRPVPVEGESVRFDVDGVIPAIGQQVMLDFLPGKTLKVDPETGMSQLDGVFAGGDAIRGASTLIEAIGDGRRAALNILKYINGTEKPENLRELQEKGYAEYHRKLVHRQFGIREEMIHNPDATGFELATRSLSDKQARTESERCLSCDLFCSICTTVCPNRANIACRTEQMSLPLQVIELSNDQISVSETGRLNIEERFQILNIGDFCNECGNCTTFCPTAGAPYRDKPRICLSRDAFEAEENAYFLEGNNLFARNGGIRRLMKLENGTLLYAVKEAQVKLDPDTLSVIEVKLNSGAFRTVDLAPAAEMLVLLKSLQGFYLYP